MRSSLVSQESTSRARRTHWPSWVGYGAVIWSLSYGALGLLWSMGGPGFPFGEGEIPEVRHHTVLGQATSDSFAGWIAGIGFVSAVIALLMVRRRLPRWAAYPVIGMGWILAGFLIAIIPDHRPLMALAFTPAFLTVVPFGWPEPFGEFIELVYPWTTINLMICLVGGVLWALATVAYQRSVRENCRSCGRTHGKDSGWTHPGAAARWGRWAVYVAIVIPLVYAASRLLWALNIPFTISREFLDELWDSGAVWAGLFLALMACVGSLLTLGLIQKWGVIWPRWVLGLAGRRVPPKLPFVAASIVAITVASAGTTMWMVVDWSEVDSVMGNPGLVWPLWSVALGAAAIAYYLRWRPACLVCSPISNERAAPE